MPFRDNAAALEGTLYFWTHKTAGVRILRPERQAQVRHTTSGGCMCLQELFWYGKSFLNQVGQHHLKLLLDNLLAIAVGTWWQ
jgi:hypothetical protein